MANTTPRTFHYKQGTSNKFWRIWREDTAHLVQFGKIGTTGQRRFKRHATVRDANNEISRLIMRKCGKGYVEVYEDGSPMDYMVTFEKTPITRRKRKTPKAISNSRDQGAAARKAWETRRKNAAAKKKPKPVDPPGFLRPRRVPKVTE